jgi:deoxyribodipyrimidine photolyase-related protein
MQNLVVILGDQLSHNISSLDNFSKEKDIVFLAEVMEEATYVPHHKLKLSFIFSAMRHFAEELKSKGFKVIYTELTDPNNSNNLNQEILRISSRYKFEKIIATEPSEYRVLENLKKIKNIELRADKRFICSKQEFYDFAKNKKSLVMEFFYRQMRKKTSLLIQNNKPVGNNWNFDKENRKTIPDDIKIPEIIKFNPDKITQKVIELVNQKFPNNFGNNDNFYYAINHEQAQDFFDDFLKNRLKNFGDYQDAMQDNLEFGFHSVISMYINVGLLDALECCKKVEEEFFKGNCSLNSAEGFIRQIIGWREYINGIYWLYMPNYKNLNFLNANKNLPWFYWDSDKTEMNCIKNVVKQTYKNAYSHHIQRLMVTGNLALLSGIHPDQINEWYMAVYADAFEWAELPNTHGMSIYADGGIVGSKPYCASGKYINKMSNYCKNCSYNVEKTIGEDACPFNFLYWNFLLEHQNKFRNNQRMRYSYLNLDKKSENEIEQIKKLSQDFFVKYF